MSAVGIGFCCCRLLFVLFLIHCLPHYSEILKSKKSDTCPCPCALIQITCCPIGNSVPWNKPSSWGAWLRQCSPLQSSVSSQDSGCSGNYTIVHKGHQEQGSCDCASFWCQGILEGSLESLGDTLGTWSFKLGKCFSWVALGKLLQSTSFHIGKVWVLVKER